MPPVMKRKMALHPVIAFWGALMDRSIAHYPRFSDDKGYWEQPSAEQMIEQIAGELAGVKADGDALEDALDRGRESLDEVKALTEYQDQKATRLLTIITFLSALSGILFGRFIDAYPLRTAAALGDQVLIAASYALFGLFALFAICGALIVFHATRTQFLYPDPKARGPERATSYLFYRSIIEVKPRTWARSFLDSTDTAKLAPDLQIRYLRNYIVETYLVAAKVAEKLRYLEPAQIVLSWSIRVLLVWLIVSAATIVFVPVKATSVISSPAPANSAK